MNKFVFVILHYYTIEDTKKCVSSILEKGKDKNIDIVIVDNASPNNTGKEIKNIYKDKENIHVILNEKNLGFANGNNVGFIYAKEELNADFIIMCNNDTYLLQDNFFDLIVEEFYNSNFAVLGPKIILPNNIINPVILELPTVKVVKRQLLETRLNYITNLLFVNKLYKVIRKILKNVLIKMKLKKIKEEKKKENNTEKRYENIVLHGSFLIFSKNYINKFDGINNKTFLYREEELLAIRLKNSKLNSVYNPKIEIFHNEDGATNAVTKSKRNKKLFVDKYQIKSTKILLEEMQK